MKKLIICTAVLGLAFSSAAQAKGCIKGAIVGVSRVQSPVTVRSALLLVA
jgi:hypothetical protein